MLGKYINTIRRDDCNPMQPRSQHATTLKVLGLAIPLQNFKNIGKLPKFKLIRQTRNVYL